MGAVAIGDSVRSKYGRRQSGNYTQWMVVDAPGVMLRDSGVSRLSTFYDFVPLHDLEWVVDLARHSKALERLEQDIFNCRTLDRRLREVVYDDGIKCPCGCGLTLCSCCGFHLVLMQRDVVTGNLRGSRRHFVTNMEAGHGNAHSLHPGYHDVYANLHPYW